MASATQTISPNHSGRLPVELLEEILSWATGQIELHLPTLPRLHGDNFEPTGPWDLALVCRDWRDAVLSTPYIWSNISLRVFPDKDNVHNCDALLSALELCLDRSCNHPLTIEFLTRDRDSSNHTSVFLKLLMEHAQRWEAVTFCAPLCILSLHLSNYPFQYTRLRRLDFENFSGEFNEDWVGIFRDVPLLSSISLNHCPYDGKRLGRIGIPWSQITHLKMSAQPGTLDDLLDILKCTSNLVVLNYCLTFDYSGQGGLPILELPHLQRLVWENHVYDDDNDDASLATCHFFELLKAPRLSVLKVRGVCGNEEVEAIQGCIRRSGCSITSLDLLYPHLSSLLRLTPNIKTLVFLNEVTDEEIDDDDFSYGPLQSFELAHLQRIVCASYIHDRNDEIYGPAVSEIFDLLTAPQLSVLEIRGNCCDRELKAICGLLQRSQCSIRSLSLPTEHLPSLRYLTPDVETLGLPYFYEEYLAPLFRELTFDHSADSWLFPKLKKLIVYYNIAAGPPFDAFVGMLESRLQASPNSLEMLRCNKLRVLELGTSVSKDMRHWIQEKFASQEHLVITYSEPPFRMYDRWDS